MILLVLHLHRHYLSGLLILQDPLGYTPGNYFFLDQVKFIVVGPVAHDGF